MTFDGTRAEAKSQHSEQSSGSVLRRPRASDADISTESEDQFARTLSRVARAARDVLRVAYAVMALSVIIGVLVACLSESSSDGLTSAHPYIGLGAGIAVVGLLQGFLIRFAAILGAAWVESRTED